uniref:Cystatin-Igu-3 n=1 Tax=Iguana iguana TaxID=8517 RepID=M9T289_IGUIG
MDASRLLSLGCRLSWALLVLLPPPAAPALGHDHDHDQPGIVGGWRARSPSDPDVVEATAFCVGAYNEASNSAFLFKAARVVEAESQVVAGTKYSLTIELVRTVCEKKGGSGLKDVDLERCEVASDAEQEKEICTFQVWSRPWLNDTQLLQMSCKAASS